MVSATKFFTVLLCFFSLPRLLIKYGLTVLHVHEYCVAIGIGYFFKIAVYSFAGYVFKHSNPSLSVFE